MDRQGGEFIGRRLGPGTGKVHVSAPNEKLSRPHSGESFTRNIRDPKEKRQCAHVANFKAAATRMSAEASTGG
jgi:hypothetical protein